MKKICSMLAIAVFTMVATSSIAQKNEDKSKRASPPAVVSQVISSGAKIKIDYSQPSVKGRVIGKDIEPMEGQIWRAGANEATVFETDKNVQIQGKPLPAGKYAFFVTKNGDKYTLVFNKTWETWGAYDYEKNKANDALTVTVPVSKAPVFTEKLTYTIAKDGQVALLWGNTQVRFGVK